MSRDFDNGQNKSGEKKPGFRSGEGSKGRNSGERRFDGNRSGKGEGFKGERKFDDKPRKDFVKGERKFDDKPRKDFVKGERKFDDKPRKDFVKGERKFDDKPRKDFAKGERKFDDKRPRDGKSFDKGERRDGFRPGREGQKDEGREKRGIRVKTARDAALAALQDVVRREAYASQALDRALTDAELSPEDRRLAASLFYFTVENRLYIEWALGRLMETKPDPMVSDILHIAAAQILFMDRIPDHAAVDEAVKQARNAGRGGMDKLVNGVLRNLVRARDNGEMVLPDKETQPEEYLSIRYSLALPAVKRLVAAYGFETAEEICAYVPGERTLTVRPNTTRISCEDFEAMLTKEGFSWKRGAVKNAYILSGAGSLAEHEGYRTGLFSIQGESSMLAAMAVEAKGGMQLLDACAAPGGKTCLMAEQMNGSGRVFAWDVHAHRVDLIRAAAHRLGLENVRPTEHDARKALESMELSMDAVLVDAPCSGLGVMSDKPDIRFKLTDAELDALVPIQREILEACAKSVKVGGRLVYSTCTILPEENENQVRDFLARHPEFEPDNGEKWLPEALRGKMQDGMLQLLPARDGVEGFFIARMRRRSI